MRDHLVLITCLALATGCAQNQVPGAGTLNNVCRSGWLGWAGWCDDGLGCYNGTCLSCGHAGEPCCNDDNFKCLEGSCDTSTDEVGTCTASCGVIGSSCCADPDNPCPGVGTCNVDNKCDGGGADNSCFTGATAHIVYLVDGNCGSPVQITLHTDTVDQAEACRQQLIAAGGGNVEGSTLDGAPPTLASVCKANDVPGYSAYYFWHYSDYQLSVCEATYGDGSTWTAPNPDGSCP